MRHDKAVAVLKLARTLASTWEGLTIDGMADALGVGRRTAERLRDAVQEVFGTLETIDDGRRKRFRLPARGLDRFVTAPTADELTELETAARTLDPHDHARAMRLRTLGEKVRASLREADRRRLTIDVEDQLRVEALAFRVGPRPMVETATLTVLREALLTRRAVRFDYRADGGAELRRRTVVPYGLLFGPRYYLIAAMKGHDSPALYRLDAVHAAEATDEPGSPPADFDLAAWAERSFGVFQEDPRDVVLQFSTAAAGDARNWRFHPTQSIEDRPDGSLIVRFRAGGLLQIAHHLMTWGETVTIHAPTELQDRMRELVAVLHRHHAVPSPKGEVTRSVEVDVGSADVSDPARLSSSLVNARGRNR